ncbi:MAG: RHS repeat-associated core domain-containing protein [Deltaproteobacteria bacterium]|nr:RHS repeat-associated core domain-containing protein [Deltaproteobacteria bacterium]
MQSGSGGLQDALNQITALSYGEAGCPSCSGVDQLNSVTDAKSQQTSFSYDQLGRLVTATDPLGLATTYSYGATKNPTTKTAPDTTSISYTYDALQRLTQKTYPDATTATYGYDNRGNLTSAANASVSYIYVYDAANRLTSATDSRGFTIDYQYDAAGNRTSMTLQPGTPDEQVIGYTYDNVNRLSGMTSPAGAFSLGYDLLNRRTSLGYPNGVSAGYSYDPNSGWLNGIDYQNLGVGVAYPQFDAVGNRLARSEDGTTTSYGYDATYQLTQAKTGALEENFTYDAVGNRESGPTVKDTPAAAYAHDAANRMTQGRKFDYAYDARGNQTHRYLNATHTDYWQYTWDAENQLTQAQLVTDGVTLRTLNFKYDPFGRRIEKQVVDTLSTTTTRYIHDREDIVLQLVDDGTTSVMSRYVHGPGTDEPLALVKNGQSYYYHADGQGSVLALSDSSNSIIQRYKYDSFGALTAIQDTEFGNAYTYTGREWDREMGLYYYRARYYDPMEGRFISKDPIGFAGGGM